MHLLQGERRRVHTFKIERQVVDGRVVHVARGKGAAIDIDVVRRAEHKDALAEMAWNKELPK
jgi:hypothetical protein